MEFLVTLTKSKSKFITVVRQVLLKVMYVTRVLAYGKANGLMKVLIYENFFTSIACMTARETVNVYPDRPFRISFASFRKVVLIFLNIKVPLELRMRQKRQYKLKVRVTRSLSAIKRVLGIVQ